MLLCVKLNVYFKSVILGTDMTNCLQKVTEVIRRDVTGEGQYGYLNILKTGTRESRAQ